MDTDTPDGYCEMIDLDLIRRALDGTDVDKAKAHLDRIVKFKPGDLIEYSPEKDKWVSGVVVAWMVHEPHYICGRGEDRNKPGKKLLGGPPKLVRARRMKESK